MHIIDGLISNWQINDDCDKHKLWKKYIATRDVKVIREYKIVRNKVRKEWRKLDKLHQLEIAKSCKTNPKCFWKHIREKNWCS